MKPQELKEKYLLFFEKYPNLNHKRLASAPLIPENDPTVLFTTAGMHPLVPFLLGQPHPLGKRVVDVQKCIRTGDIDEVGDTSHLTFFEMLGNWSFGDYFKQEAIQMSFDFLIKELKFSPDRLAVSVFAGDDDAPFDTVAYNKWLSLGIPDSRIARLDKKGNWWGPAGLTGPCGPDTEIFYWLGDEDKVPTNFNDDNDLWLEIWNNVFMEYEKQTDGSFKKLTHPNVDTGMGVERVVAIMQNKQTVYEISSIQPIYNAIKDLAQIEDAQTSCRIITDHIRAAVFVLGDERSVTPSNVDQGYVLRKFIRRSIRHCYLLKVENVNVAILTVAQKVIDQFGSEYPNLFDKKDFIISELEKEANKFINTLGKGLKLIEKKIQSEAIKVIKKKPTSREDVLKIYDNFLASKPELSIDAKWLFDLFQSQGMPPEMTIEELESHNIIISNKKFALKEFDTYFKKHQELSRIGAEKKFKGGLADNSQMTTNLHTATHLLGEALRKVLGSDVKQRGSNITADRLRFDFNFDRKLTQKELQEVEDLVNKQIRKGLLVTKEKMKLEDALKSGAQSEFSTRYPEEVWVYRIGDFSKEICMGPHAKNSKDLGTFKIIKEQSSAAGIRRIKAVLI